MSFRITITGKTTELLTHYFPPIVLDDGYNWEVGLIGLETYCSIPNLDSLNNTMVYYDDENQEKTITIPEGSYEIDSLNRIIKKSLGTNNFALTPNNNTLKSRLYTRFKIDFTKPNSIGQLLGFSPQILDPEKTGQVYESNKTVSIMRVNSISVHCNIVAHSFRNGRPVHILHEFFPNVDPGYKILEIPASPIYLPINCSQIDSISIRLTDQDGNLINLRGEVITIALHIRKNGS